jgi:hypothetical protein
VHQLKPAVLFLHASPIHHRVSIVLVVFSHGFSTRL